MNDAIRLFCGYKLSPLSCYFIVHIIIELFGEDEFRRRIRRKSPIFIMNKALLTVLVIVLVAGVFVEQGDALLRAGRDRIEKLQRRDSDLTDTEAAKIREELCQLCYNEDNVEKKKWSRGRN
ncbi:hypothetical protein OS493_022251 [Desmophyllum pertusum]|uniref:Uncharacterized protein n=1 Tax=Desmophyllum pertusum TaxID=174260 RepID=A0A9X0CDP8_9CNID|nr:hypothetical protein OS493_022251 [Desmophyllum pertusum]